MQLKTLYKHVINDFIVFHHIDVAYIFSHFSDVERLNFRQFFTCINKYLCDEDLCA